MKQLYETSRVTGATLDLIKKANEIIYDYIRQGYSLTLRQLYYQFVAKDLLENSDKSYKLLGRAINTGRMIGMVDWDAIEDRTRFPRGSQHWDSPKDFFKAAIRSYNVDKWSTTDIRLEVWVEKDALIDIVENVCYRYDVTCFSCRGYVSQTAMREAALRFIQKPGVIIHLGDHDPSGIDMTRDIQDRLKNFGAKVWVDRIALHMEQIDRYNPPPNPAKITDSRAKDYIKKFGQKSWELDALPPQVLADLIQDNIKLHWDEKAWKQRKEEEEEAIRKLGMAFNKIKF